MCVGPDDGSLRGPNIKKGINKELLPIDETHTIRLKPLSTAHREKPISDNPGSGPLAPTSQQQSQVNMTSSILLGRVQTTVVKVYGARRPRLRSATYQSRAAALVHDQVGGVQNDANPLLAFSLGTIVQIIIDVDSSPKIRKIHNCPKRNRLVIDPAVLCISI